MTERGNVKWFNNKHGWGFIERSGKPDVYVRHDRISGAGFKALREGEIVEFEVREGAHGPYAVKVARVASDDDLS